MGETKSVEFNDFAWYKLIYDAFQKLPHQRIGDIYRFETQQLEPPENKETLSIIQQEKIALPEWVFHHVIDDNLQKKDVIQPSRLSDDAEDRAKSPIDPDNLHRFKRGNLTHKLFQILPDIPEENRRKAAEAFIARLGKDLGENIRADIINETLKILNDPVFADVFGENSMAEVPISGDMGDGKMISGQIDRLVIGHNKILIVDFKTNRPSPRSENDIPEAYKKQLRAYKIAISRIFPEKEIFCALLWTDQPLLMPINI
jgi:ATP-dependent helicase/nuclease subunit A